MLRKPQQRIVEIDGEKEPLNLPIVKFPPFKLRAQLIEKDPVVWLHLIETYVKYCQWLMAGDNSMGSGSHISMIDQLDENTLDHLRIFLRSYLHEMALEEGKLVSLGYNQDVKKQLQLLRSWIFHIIKSCGLIYLQIFGDTLWDLIKLYVVANPKSVQSLILGTLIPTVNVQRAQINRIAQLQQSLKIIIESNKFDRTDLKTFQSLLSYHDEVEENYFADEFLTLNWVENLELWWSKGKGRFNEISRQICITILFSVHVNKLAKFLTDELDITNVDSLMYYPLLGSIITSEHFLNQKGKLVQFLPFIALSSSFSAETSSNKPIHEVSYLEVDTKDILALQELFPYLTQYQATQLLRQYDNNVQLITNELFENPTIIESLEPEAEPEAVPEEVNSEQRELEVDVEENDENKPLMLVKKKDGAKYVTKHVPDEVRNKTLTRALKLLYQDDEDERDDTYDEAQVENNRINSGNQKIGINNDISKSIENDIEEDTNKDTISQTDRNEAYLWDLLKQDKSLFERNKRGSSSRKKIRQQTNWSDEQIEGWARMLERSPQRARLLEDKYMFRGNVKSGKTSYVKNRDVEAVNNDDNYYPRPSRGNGVSGPRTAKNPKLNKKKYQKGPKKTGDSKNAAGNNTTTNDKNGDSDNSNPKGKNTSNKPKPKQKKK
ncbi:RQC trigger complex subunit Cue3p [Monosporozyma servazzii]